MNNEAEREFFRMIATFEAQLAPYWSDEDEPIENSDEEEE